MAYGLKFGEMVEIKYKLRRESSGGWPWRNFWAKSKFPTPRTGVYIGYRTLANGEVRYNGEEGTEFKADEYFQAALVVLSERSKPVLVRIEDVSPKVKS